MYKMISKALGKEMVVITVAMDAWITGAVDAGIDQWTAKHFYGSMYTAIESGDLETVSTTLEELLGRRPQDNGIPNVIFFKSVWIRSRECTNSTVKETWMKNCDKVTSCRLRLRLKIMQSLYRAIPLSIKGTNDDE
jgi:hypothetical protein